MAGQRDPVVDFGQRAADFPQDLAGVVLDLGTAGIEHRAVLRIDDLDLQAFVGDVQADLVLELPQGLAAGDQCLHPHLELAKTHLLLTRRFRLGRLQVVSLLLVRLVALLDLTGLARQVGATALQDR